MRPQGESGTPDSSGAASGAHIDGGTADDEESASTRAETRLGAPLRFLTVSLDYHPCFKDEAVNLPTERCDPSNYGCYSQANYLHPILRFYDILPSTGLRHWKAKAFETGATREFHLTEDLSLAWDQHSAYTTATRTFLERIDMLRRGMGERAAPRVPPHDAEPFR